jgi:hypothetical protein
MAGEIASYMGQDSSRLIGLDGFNDESVVAVRDALLAAGVPAARIRIGGFGDPQFRREGRVAVLFRN